MKRSRINAEIQSAIKLFDQIGFKLPPFAFWTPEDWSGRINQVREIMDNRLGWDVTDYGHNTFDKMGLLLFTIRKGNAGQPDIYAKPYAEKLMVCREGQVAPMHFHWRKMEDIINRGGGNLVLRMHGAAPDGTLSREAFEVSIDGQKIRVEPGQEIILTPGESIFLEPFVYHEFYAQQGTGPVVIGEVSSVNDDEEDNRFLESMGRFPAIEEDEPPLYLLCTDYKERVLKII
ncbi:D-lyxose/D-mannose family sugar isomerase [Desulfospira joergensenii]|uniref:D-lyxose/D-mannose family sugar isomerase n=1 Tax=Desulfospira joergensenii TaxID=53329 RepID=UPI0003B33CDE|nr:D-lyxose/D-mannose family sugar isomerase [Desulfospira joergensenii]